MRNPGSIMFYHHSELLLLAATTVSKQLWVLQMEACWWYTTGSRPCSQFILPSLLGKGLAPTLGELDRSWIQKRPLHFSNLFYTILVWKNHRSTVTLPVLPFIGHAWSSSKQALRKWSSNHGGPMALWEVQCQSYRARKGKHFASSLGSFRIRRIKLNPILAWKCHKFNKVKVFFLYLQRSRWYLLGPSLQGHVLNPVWREELREEHPQETQTGTKVLGSNEGSGALGSLGLGDFGDLYANQLDVWDFDGIWQPEMFN